jgi:GT2 family glycosyltransferase
MPDTPPSVVTIVLNWNGIADTRECLNSVRAAAYPENHVLVVDNGSKKDEAGALESEYGGFIEMIRLPENRGFAGGMNVGIKRALELVPDYLLLLNNDVVVDPSFLSKLVDQAKRLPKLAAACPKTYFYSEPRMIYSTGGRVNIWRGVAKQVGRGQEDHGQFEKVARRDYADGMCMLIPRSAIEKVGLLDEQYFAYWEETDWCWRAREAGLRCYYVPQSRIWHKAQRSRSPNARFHYLYRRNALLFVRKRGTPLQVATALGMHLFVYGPLYFAQHPRQIARAGAELRALVWHARNQPRERPLI